MDIHEGGGARRRLDAVLFGAKDHRHHYTATPRQLILIMVASPADALALVKGGVPITEISIGHMQAGEGKRPATPAVAIDDADVAALRELQKLGIELEIRYLPNSNPDPIGNLFN